jgi:hypothetical protein
MFQSTHAGSAKLEVSNAPMNLDDPRYLPVVFPIFFVFMWVTVGFVIAQLGGWGELARYYRLQNPFDDKRWHCRSGRMRWTARYNGCLTIGAGSRGLYLAVLFLFRVGHPPLLIPWGDISVKTGKTLWWNWTEFRFRQAPGVYLKIWGGMDDEIRYEAGAFWPRVHSSI